MLHGRRPSRLARVALVVPLLVMCLQSTGVAVQGAVPTWAESTLAKMTLREKVGQMFVTYVYGQSAYDADPSAVRENRRLFGVDNAAQLVARYRPGGVIYFGWAKNLNNLDQIARLSNGIQSAALGQRVPVPMLISTDQEQGIVSRLPPPATRFPSSMALGATRSPADAGTAASITGKELRAVGINQNFAPVADVNVNPGNPVINVRSFGSDPSLVGALTDAQVRGFQAARVAATTKHFPGHGDTDTDSHTGLPVIRHSSAELDEIDLPPFRAAISAGVDSIMTAHIVVPVLDPSGRPATLSKPILTGLLRDRLGFTGVIVTDSLEMVGVRQMFADSRVPVEAIKAGADILLMPPDLRLAIESVVNAVSVGELGEARINASVLRILRLKEKLRLPTNALVDRTAISGVVGIQAHRDAARRISDKSVTLIKNDTGVLPIAPSSGKSVLVTGWTTATLAERVAALGVTAQRIYTGRNPTQAQIDSAVAAAMQHDVTVVTTMNARSYNGQQDLVRALVRTGAPIIVVGVRQPYDIASFTEASTYLATYGYDALSQAALARVLFGQVNPSGKLPVAIPATGQPDTDLYPYGHGLQYAPAGR